MISITNQFTGEIYEVNTDTPEQIRDSWILAQSLEKSATKIKDKLKPFVANLIEANGTKEIGDYAFRQSTIQRQNYDKSVLREIFDEDLLDLFLEPNKTAIDKYIKENVEELGEQSTKLRETMIAVGQPYSVTKLEKR